MTTNATDNHLSKMLRLVGKTTPEPPDSAPDHEHRYDGALHPPLGAEPPDSGDGAAPVTSSDIDKNAVNVPSRMRLMGKFLGGAAKEELDGMADLLDRAEPRDAGIDAALERLMTAVGNYFVVSYRYAHGTGGGATDEKMDATTAAMLDAYQAAARLRSGSPAPEGGESQRERERRAVEGDFPENVVRAAAPAEAREEGPTDA